MEDKFIPQQKHVCGIVLLSIYGFKEKHWQVKKTVKGKILNDVQIKTSQSSSKLEFDESKKNNILMAGTDWE